MPSETSNAPSIPGMLTPATTKEISPCLYWFKPGASKRAHHSLGRVNSVVLSIDVEDLDFGTRAVTANNVRQRREGDRLVLVCLKFDDARESRLPALRRPLSTRCWGRHNYQKLTLSGRRTTVPAGSARDRWSHPAASPLQTRRISCSRAAGSQSKIIHPAAGVTSLIALAGPDCKEVQGPTSPPVVKRTHKLHKARATGRRG